ncbi:hypothetical protein ACGFX4_28240 [Kitasatospora sp. NPDC048365]|uniref:hypothetical protein n=1 Tax=Kitasatospora sp. NPDC048365 TaxID=3364050 RepID=UPI003713E79D
MSAPATPRPASEQKTRARQDKYETPEELRLARRLRVGRIVIDNLAEIARLAALTVADTPQRVLVRVVPGVAAGHHSAVRTGVDGQKFGFSLAGGDAADAIARVLAQPGLHLVGLHCQLSMASGYNLVGRPLRDLRVGRRLVHHAQAAQQPRLPQSRRLRERPGGLTTTPTVSVKAGQAQAPHGRPTLDELLPLGRPPHRPTSRVVRRPVGLSPSPAAAGAGWRCPRSAPSRPGCACT